MPPVLHARDLTKTFGTRTLFSDVSVSLDERERLALIGPNGSGKSTLLRLLAGLDRADEGELVIRRGVRVAYVAQSDSFPKDSTVFSALVDGLIDAMKAGQTPHLHDDHEAEMAAYMILGRLDLPDDQQPTASLSGGQRKRLAIARELAKEPDVLLLDEPTNHMDLEGIEWIESVLRTPGPGGSKPPASIMVTHDRSFLENVATRIVELARWYPSGTFSVNGNYSEFLRRKGEFLDGQAKTQQSLANQVRDDLRWLARGAKARRTKSKSRIEASFERIDELAELKARNAPQKVAGIEFNATGRQSQKLLHARAISKRFGDGAEARVLFSDLDVMLSPGSILGLMGPNGSGKTTLIKVLLGQLESDAPSERAVADDAQARRSGDIPPSTPAPGTIGRADKLRTVLFSQHRRELDPGMTLRDALSPQSDSVIYRDKTVHVNSWAKRFLFTAEQLKQPIRALSGGEQARIHIANLMLEPADVLVLDEPTNDLDLASLEVLEESIEEFPGAVILVTHDRAMLGRLATQILALDGHGGSRYFADYEEWERRATSGFSPTTPTPSNTNTTSQASPAKPAAAPASAAAPSAPPNPAKPKRKLSYKEQQELDAMEKNIAKAEADVRTYEAQMNDPAVVADRRRMDEACRKLGEAQSKVATLYARWTELEG